MKARLGDMNKAIELRKLGQSYKEIQSTVKVSKGLLSLWLSDIKLTEDEARQLKMKLEERRNKGKISSKILNQARMLERERKLIRETEALWPKRRNDPVFMFGVTLFWAQGHKSGGDFNFSSSNTDMIFIMYAWALRYLVVPKDKVKIRLFMFESSNNESIKGFWAKNLHVKPEDIKVTLQKKKEGITKNDPYYKGCVRLTIVGIRYFRLMKAWQKLCIEYYGKALLG